MIASVIFASSTLCPLLQKSSPVVRTIAGSVEGLSDGKGSQAKFLTPTGLAIDRQGQVIVADASGQRIRRIDKDGRVETIAGAHAPASPGLYVTGGYKDGPVSEAEFQNPNAVAVAENGDILVADTDNDSVRVIHKGVVSTLIGGPGKQGPDLGTASTVTATRVMAVAIDALGNIYFGNERGLRILQPSGKVVRFNDEIRAVYAVSVYGSGPSRAIYEVTSKGIEYYGPRGQRILRSNSALVDGQSDIAADDLIGSPIGITAINDREAAVTDAGSGTVYILDAQQGRIDYTFGSLAQSHSGDEAVERDGPPLDARFNEPWGVIYDSTTHALTISDAGSGRIRQIVGFRLRGPSDGATVGEAAQAEPPTLRVALVGNSFTYFHTNFDQSIEGGLERTLSAQTGRCVAVDAVGLGSDLNAYRSFLSAYDGLYDIIILQLNGTQIAETYGPKPGRNFPFGYDGSSLAATAPVWGPKLRRFLSDEDSSVKAQGHRLLVVTHPYPQDVSASEMLWNRFVIEYGPGLLKPERGFGLAFNRVISASGVSTLDLWPKFTEAETNKQCALFGTQNAHFSLCGRRLVSDALADFLLKHRWIR